jgi:hypothetical protein
MPSAVSLSVSESRTEIRAACSSQPASKHGRQAEAGRVAAQSAAVQEKLADTEPVGASRCSGKIAGADADDACGAGLDN